MLSKKDKLFKLKELLQSMVGPTVYTILLLSKFSWRFSTYKIWITIDKKQHFNDQHVTTYSSHFSTVKWFENYWFNTPYLMLVRFGFAYLSLNEKKTMANSLWFVLNLKEN